VVTERYKLIRFYGYDVPNMEEFELYDLERDPQEMRSEYSNPEYADLVAKLKVKLQDLRDQYEVVDIPQVKPTYGEPGSKMK
jgi:arylsulfatase A-like enzyme